jgi:hypothetical protein
MPHYKDTQNKVHFIDDAAFEYLLPVGCMQITDAEAQLLSAPPPPSAAQIEVAFTAAIQQRLDEFARTRNYDSILSACTYATSTLPKFQTEGQACVNLRDDTWAAAYDILAAVQAGDRPMPTSLADIEDDLPALEWPL